MNIIKRLLSFLYGVILAVVSVVCVISVLYNIGITSLVYSGIDVREYFGIRTEDEKPKRKSYKDYCHKTKMETIGF